MMIKLKDVAKRVERKEKVLPEKVYCQIGVRVWGKGAYERESIKGFQTKYKNLFKVKENDIIVNKIWARNGSVSVVTGNQDGLYGSSEFPTYEINQKKMLPKWFKVITKLSWFWKKCEEKSGGTSGKNRIKPEEFLEIEIELPSIKEQKVIIKKVDRYSFAKDKVSVKNSENVELIKKLRSAILSEAVQGKLVPQNPKDEPASELLKKIKTEKDKLIREKKIKKEKPLPLISEEEKPYELPKGWVWCRLGNIGLISSSSRVHQRDWTNTGIPFYRAREIVKLAKYGEVNNELFISEELFRSLTVKGLKPEDNDIMITGVGTIGVPYIVKKEDRFYFKDASIIIFKNFYKLYSKYLYIFLMSPLWNQKIYSESKGTTVDTLTITRANAVLVPLPPLPEQHSIVEKVDKLMKLCDELEEKVKENQQNAEKLMEAVLREAFEN